MVGKKSQVLISSRVQQTADVASLVLDQMSNGALTDDIYLLLVKWGYNDVILK